MSLVINAKEIDQPAIWSISPYYDRDHLVQLRSPVSPAIPIIGRPAAATTFREAMDRFMKENVRVRRTPKGIAAVERVLSGHLYPRWADLPLYLITKQTVRSLLHDIGTSRPAVYRDRTDGRQGRANSIFWVLRAFFKWASDENNGHPYLDANPLIGLKQPFRTGERDRVLNADEIRLFWIATGTEKEPFASIARLLLLTGQRRSEIAEMQRWQIDWRGQTLTLPIRMTKSQRAHVVPLSDLAMKVLDAVPRRAGEMMLFGRDGDRLHSSSSFCGANQRIEQRMLELRRQEIVETGGDLDDAHTPHWVFHDLRRTAMTVMCELGHSLPVVDKILNHGPAGGGVGRTINSVARVYCKYEFMPERRAALQDLAAHVGALVGFSSLR